MKDIYSVAFFTDGKHVVSGSASGRWQGGGKANVCRTRGPGTVCNIGVSQDGKWIVSGTAKGLTVRKAGSHSKQPPSKHITTRWLQSMSRWMGGESQPDQARRLSVFGRSPGPLASNSSNTLTGWLQSSFHHCHCHVWQCSDL